MSLLSIVQDAAAELNSAIPGYVVGATDPLGIQMHRLASKAAKELYRQYDWMLLRKEATITIVAAQAAYAVEADFGRLIPATWWDRGQQWSMIGPESAQEWQYRKSGIATVGPRRRFRMLPSATGGTTITLDPTPTTTDAGTIIAYEYVSKRWAQDISGTFHADWTADTDTSLIDEECITADVIWRFLRAKGLAYEDERDDAMARAAAQFAQEVSSNYLPLASRPSFDSGPPYPTIPDAGYGT